MNEDELIEALAAIEHDRWSHWQRYLHSQCDKLPDGALLVPSKLVRRWEDQIERTYGELSEEEKESDREQVKKVLPIIRKFASSK